MTTYSYEDHKEEIKKQVFQFIRKTSPHLYYQQEDLLQEATLKFLECTKTYKEGDVPFVSFLKTCVKNHLTDYVRSEIKYNRSRKNKPLDVTGEDDYIHETHGEGYLQQADENAINARARELLKTRPYTFPTEALARERASEELNRNLSAYCACCSGVISL